MFLKNYGLSITELKQKNRHHTDKDQLRQHAYPDVPSKRINYAKIKNVLEISVGFSNQPEWKAQSKNWRAGLTTYLAVF